MKILITGGTGLVGNSLVKSLRAKNHDVVILSRKSDTKNGIFKWDIEKEQIDEDVFFQLDGIIHLAGASIAKRWSNDYKKMLYDSRVKSAELLLKYCKELNIKLQFFVSASGINYYGTFTSEIILNEEMPIKNKDFLAKLCVDWEKSAHSFNEIAERTVILRTALVLAKNGGSFPYLKKITDLHLASPVGTGKQWMNWIHIQDLVSIYEMAIENRNLNGIYNASSTEPVTNKEFMKTLADLRKKFFLPFPIPGFILKLVLGEMSGIILEGSRISNKKLNTIGYTFIFPKLKETLENLHL